MGRVSDARQRLLDAAIGLMHARSYADVGVQELCRRAGVQKGSFYHFFRSKEQLALAALEQQWRCVREELIEPALATDVPPLARIERLAQMQGERLASARAVSGATPGCHFGNLGVELSTKSEPVRRAIADILAAQADAIRATLDEAVARQELPPCDTAAAAESVVAYLQGLQLLAKVRDEPLVLERLGGRIQALLGLGAPQVSN